MLFSGAVTLINVPVIFCTFAACVLWWIATGLDGWAPNGGGVGNSVAALAKPATAGTGAFGGVLSTPFTFVALNVFVTLMLGLLFGMASTRVAALLTPGDKKRAKTEAADEAGCYRVDPALPGEQMSVQSQERLPWGNR